MGGINKNTSTLIKIPNVPKNKEIWKWSNPIQVRKMADKYFGKDKQDVFLSDKKEKK
jgi:hypothetical protein